MSGSLTWGEVRLFLRVHYGYVPEGRVGCPAAGSVVSLPLVGGSEEWPCTMLYEYMRHR